LKAGFHSVATFQFVLWILILQADVPYTFTPHDANITASGTEVNPHYVTNKTDYMEETEDNIRSASQENLRILWGLKLYYRVFNNRPLISDLSQVSPAHIRLFLLDSL
jgi:hypothetical protein